MLCFKILSSSLLLATSSFQPVSASRLRHRNKATRVRTTTDFVAASTKWRTVHNDPTALLDELQKEEDIINIEIEQQQDLAEMMQAMEVYGDLSMETASPTDSPTKSPSIAPTSADSAEPSLSVVPSQVPTDRGSRTNTPSVSMLPSVTPSVSSSPSSEPSVSSSPSSEPSVSVQPSSEPSLSVEPSLAPSVSILPSLKPSFVPSADETTAPSVAPSVSPSESTAPSSVPSKEPTDLPSSGPTGTPSSRPTEAPSSRPTSAPSDEPSSIPTSSLSMTPSSEPTDTPSLEPSLSSAQPSTSVAPSSSPSAFPTTSPAPTNSPTLPGCQMTPEQRFGIILEILGGVADPTLFLNTTTPQGMATIWIINQDARQVCPNNPKIVQRWAMAVIYFSTGGNEWLKCGALGMDPCGFENPFEDKKRFLSEFNECQWAGISCNSESCVTEIEFEENNLVGTIPSEIGLLSELAVWGMEHGGLTSSIPTEIENLSNLIFLDLDYNDLTGSLPSGLFTLDGLTQLDLNNNRFSGSIKDIGVFPEMEFLQLHTNMFTGQIPESVGTYTKMGTFTLHQNNITGAMPDSVCELVTTDVGVLGSLIADCDEPDPDITCDCCTDCR